MTVFNRERRAGPGLLGLIALALSFASPAAAQITNFSEDVGRSIDAGLAWLDANGAFNNPSNSGDAAGLAALALLEKRQSADQDAEPLGYRNASAEDQARLDRVIAYILGRSNLAFYAYRDGNYLMALTVYLRTGGPRADEARVA
ncbi:MAG: hypothetical protein KC549_07845, partial [Myxococcales bacterium]|nr:hypothetical protein [Myxococcales bacterium]